MPKEIGLDLAVSRLRNLGIGFLFQQLLSRNASFVGFGFDELLTDQVVKRFALELVFLVAQLQQLRPQRLDHILLIDGLPGDGGDGIAGAGMRSGLAEGAKRQRQAQDYLRKYVET